MTGFIFIALLMTLVVLGAVLLPLLRYAGDAPAAWRTAGVTALVIVVGASGLYPVWSKWEWSRAEPPADSPENMVLRLNRRLADNQDDLEGWLMLGNSYATLGQMGSEQGQIEYAQSQYSRSVRAFQRADLLSKGTSRDALIGLGEALVAMDREALGGRAGQMFEKALALDPDYVKAILYGAFAAAERGDHPLARSRFQQLLDNNPPDELREIIQKQLTVMETGSVAAPVPGNASAAVSVPVRITIAASVRGNAAAGAPLFVLARIPGQRGAPLAAKRLDARFPQEVELLSTDAMIAGTGFTAGQELEIEARVANGGSAVSRSGDPFGTVRVKAGEKTRVAIEINQLKP